jgi:NAD(P)-dependent dehydrogenase (short-subunit alcohol dehydrogenase family)
VTEHPAFAEGRAAVITGAASGIGLAAAERCAKLGMRVCMVDIAGEALSAAADKVAALARGGTAGVVACIADVRREDELVRVRDTAEDAFGEVAVLMNNAAIGTHASALGAGPAWRDIIDTNLFSVVSGSQVFAPGMIEAGKPAVIINTGSKQGITCPPGNAAYNVAKAGVKVFTEQLAHELRSIDGCRVSAHLLVPGFTFTGLSRTETGVKPAGAWLPEQVVDFMLQRLAAGDFYILCPDNEVTRDVDLIENRPALSRWHPDYKEAFARFMQS